MRIYDSVYPDSKKWFRYIIEKQLPVFVFGIETTGLDTETDCIIQIAAAKCFIKDGKLKVAGSFNAYVNPDHRIIEFNEKFTGKPESFYRSQPDIATVMASAEKFFGRHPIVVTWSATDFAVPFLLAAGFKTGHLIDPAYSIDMYRIAQSLLPKTQVYTGHSFLSVADRLDIEIMHKKEGRDAGYDVNAYIQIFNRLFPDFMVGNDTVKLESVDYYEKSIYVQRLYFRTSRGRFYIDGVTGFMVEDTPGFFDAVDIDWLEAALLKGYHAKDLREVVHRYYLKTHGGNNQPQKARIS